MSISKLALAAQDITLWVMKATRIYPQNLAAAETPPSTILGMGRLRTQSLGWGMELNKKVR